LEFMSYDLMVFDHTMVPSELGALKKWFHMHMENDLLPRETPAVFHSFLESVEKVFPSMNDCPEDKLEYACDYEIHEKFIYMCLGYTVAKEAHNMIKRQAGLDNLGFWEVSQSFDRTFPVTLPMDKWPMIVEAEWVKYGKCFVYNYKEIRKILMKMNTAERSRICLTDRHGNQFFSKEQICSYFQEFADEEKPNSRNCSDC